MSKEFTVNNFKKEVLESELPVLVDFWAPWCGPCQMMTPVIEQISSDYEGRVNVGKVNVDEAENQQIASDYGIQGIPAFKIFKGGKVVADFVGARSEDDLKSEIEKYL